MLHVRFMGFNGRRMMSHHHFRWPAFGMAELENLVALNARSNVREAVMPSRNYGLEDLVAARS